MDAALFLSDVLFICFLVIYFDPEVDGVLVIGLMPSVLRTADGVSNTRSEGSITELLGVSNLRSFSILMCCVDGVLCVVTLM